MFWTGRGRRSHSQQQLTMAERADIKKGLGEEEAMGRGKNVRRVK